MSTLAILAVIVGAIALGYVIYEAAPQAATTTITWIEKGRYVFGLIFLSVVLYHMLKSGDWFQIAIAGVGIALGTIYVIVFQPHKDVV